AAQYLEAEALVGLDGDLEVIGGLGVGAADDTAGDGERLGGFRLVVVGRFHHLGQVIDAEEARVGHALLGGDAHGVEAERCVLGHFELDLQRGGAFAVVVVGGDGDLGGERRPETGRVLQIGAGEGQVDGGAALYAERGDGGECGRRGVGGGWRLRDDVGGGE